MIVAKARCELPFGRELPEHGAIAGLGVLTAVSRGGSRDPERYKSRIGALVIGVSGREETEKSRYAVGEFRVEAHLARGRLERAATAREQEVDGAIIAVTAAIIRALVIRGDRRDRRGECGNVEYSFQVAPSIIEQLDGIDVGVGTEVEIGRPGHVLIGCVTTLYLIVIKVEGE